MSNDNRSDNDRESPVTAMTVSQLMETLDCYDGDQIVELCIRRNGNGLWMLPVYDIGTGPYNRLLIYSKKTRFEGEPPEREVFRNAPAFDATRALKAPRR